MEECTEILLTADYVPRGRVTIDDSCEILKRSKHIPIRHTDEERKLFQILRGALEVSQYTDVVDVSSHMYGGWGGYHGVSGAKKEKLIEQQLNEMFSLLSGFYVASNSKNGFSKVTDQEFEQNEDFFQKIFEIGRRYKVMNPDKMRTTYGKLMFMMMDAMKPGTVKVDVYKPVLCVNSYLEERSGLDLLEDPFLGRATRVLVGGTPEEVKEESALKSDARKVLLEKYTSSSLSSGDILLVLDSIADSNAYILANRHPVDMMISYLRRFFSPDEPAEEDHSLAIKYGRGGSMLTHSHSTQYTFVLQSLLLWREIQHEMFKLWNMADDDLLGDNGHYRLVDTGQGLNRMKSCPAVGSTMSMILSSVKKRVSGWVGLSVVHLGDRDVPNPLVFIDKYTQVPRILFPLVKTIERLFEISASGKEKALELFLKHYGGVDNVVRVILRDFFRHGFDGSGDDGGSCIDGRLTSAWNWCSKIEKKEYYPVFLMTGFYGFDGDFRR